MYAYAYVYVMSMYMRCVCMWKNICSFDIHLFVCVSEPKRQVQEPIPQSPIRGLQAGSAGGD